jgi:vacuolar protein sorting-associated protein 13A/C
MVRTVLIVQHGSNNAPAGFGFGWSTESLRWEDLLAHPDRTVSCRAADDGGAPFRLNVWADYDRKDNGVRFVTGTRPRDDSSLIYRFRRSYPKLTVRMQPPLELENLLPFDIKYRVHDKNTSTSSSEFLRKGGVFPIHTVQLDHLLLLNIALQDTGWYFPLG